MDREFAALRKQLGRKVREFRKAVGLSQEALALEAGIDRTYVSQLERGICNPSLLVLHKLAKILQVKVVDLV
jgi:transcriptional regulator with XRE-family HTH domain